MKMESNPTLEELREELREMAELTSSIVTNLKYIEENGGVDETFEAQTSNIAANLKYIEENTPDDLDAMAESTNAIAANLKFIEENK